jgi:hypothetical protein
MNIIVTREWAGRSAMDNEMKIVVQTMKWAFVGLNAATIAYETKRRRLDRKTDQMQHTSNPIFICEFTSCTCS